MKKRNNNSKKKIIIGASVAAVLIIAGGSLFAYNRHRQANLVALDTPTTDEIAPTNTVNLDPPTSEDQQDAQDQKDKIAKALQDQKDNPPAAGQKQVSPVITYVSSSTLNGYVAGVFEDGGTCTATFTMGSQTFQKTSTGFANATNTGCAPISLARSDFPAGGTWSATLTYNSTTAKGASAASTFTVQ